MTLSVVSKTRLSPQLPSERTPRAEVVVVEVDVVVVNVCPGKVWVNSAVRANATMPVERIANVERIASLLFVLNLNNSPPMVSTPRKKMGA